MYASTELNQLPVLWPLWNLHVVFPVHGVGDSWLVGRSHSWIDAKRRVVDLLLLLDRTLSYREYTYLTKTAGKLKNRNNLLMKLAGSTCGASANTLRSSALARCYSAAEYCAPVWWRSAHINLVDVQLNSTVRASHFWHPPFYTSPMTSSAL